MVDQLMDELQGHTWSETGKAKRRLKGGGLEKLYYSMGFSVLIFSHGQTTVVNCSSIDFLFLGTVSIPDEPTLAGDRSKF